MKRVLVTGGTKGIGAAITKRFLEEGFYVIASYDSDTENARLLKNRLSPEFEGTFSFVRQHTETNEDVRLFMEKCSQSGLLDSGLDALILNAGCTDRTPWNQLSWDQWMHVMNVNLNAPASLLMSLDPYINQGASIIFISSDMSVFPHASSVPYTVSKAAVNGLTKALVKEYADRMIRVNAVLPGFVETPWQREKPLDQRKRICDKVALHRFASPDEIAQVVMSIYSAGYMNGALVQVDGGYCYR